MNLNRQIKRRLLAASQRAVVLPAPGCASLTAAEITDLLERLETPGEVLAAPQGSRAGIMVAPIRYRSLLELVMRLTTAQDASLVIGEGAVHNRRDLEEVVDRVGWQFYLRAGDAVILRCDSRASSLYHEGILREVAADRLARVGARIVSSEESDRAHTVTLRIYRNRCSVLISLAGAPLWKRGYRRSSYAPAPLREDIAQAAIRWSIEGTAARTAGRDAPPLHDVLLLPFSGSGTLLFEYLLARFGIPPFVFREAYAFERFAVRPPSIAWVKRRLLDGFSARISQAPPLAAHLIDRDAAAAAAAGENLSRFESLLAASGALPAGLPLQVESTAADAFARPWIRWIPADSRRVFLPMNPPLRTAPCVAFRRRALPSDRSRHDRACRKPACGRAVRLRPLPNRADLEGLSFRLARARGCHHPSLPGWAGHPSLPLQLVASGGKGSRPCRIDENFGTLLGAEK